MAAGFLDSRLGLSSLAPLLPVLGGPAKLLASPVPFSSAGPGDIFIRIDAQMSSGVGGTIFFLLAPFFRGVLFSSIAGKPFQCASYRILDYFYTSMGETDR